MNDEGQDSKTIYSFAQIDFCSKYIYSYFCPLKLLSCSRWIYSTRPYQKLQTYFAWMVLTWYFYCRTYVEHGYISYCHCWYIQYVTLPQRGDFHLKVWWISNQMNIFGTSDHEISLTCVQLGQWVQRYSQSSALVSTITTSGFRTLKAT